MHCGQMNPNFNNLQVKGVYIRKESAERVNDECMLPTVKLDGRSVMWGCFQGKRTGGLIPVKGILKKEKKKKSSILQITSRLYMIGKNSFNKT